ncbi:hypothetical protein [Galbibacter sp. PAP.153]|uniref:hypothetical protein n=1 Tax=Galbibacter sp. PAP.153 TaxID=3104623 RepID=UPI003009E647
MSFPFISCSSDDDSTQEEPEVEETILSYQDVEFGQTTDADMGIFFSSSTGEVFNSEEAASNADVIELAYVGSESTFIYFTSPDDSSSTEVDIPNARSTKVMNAKTGVTGEMFDDIDEADDFDSIEVVNDNEAIGTLEFPVVVLFETQDGKKGAVKLKAINATRLLVDIKVVK